MTDTEPTGIPRTDPFLALDDAGLALRDTITAETRRLHRNAFCGKTNIFAAQQFLNPQPGDLVLELTRASWTTDRRIKASGLGYLLADDGNTAWVQYGPNPDDVCEWQNAMFVRVPDSALNAVTPNDPKE